MGEIATWAYIKEQTSLGYDTNECPTKKEILAFPQEGKDWDDPAFDIGSFTYKKLGVDPRVLQNFGDNETVLQTRVGYYFYRRLLKIQSSPLGSNESNALTIPKEGGTFTAIVKVGLEKLFKVNGANVVADDKLFPIKLFLENEDSLPDYLTYSLSEPDADGYTTIIFSVTENLSTSTRGPRRICFGLDTEHYGYLGFYNQEAGTEIWEYTFTANNTTLNFPAVGGSGTPGSIGITSTKQKFINGNAVGSAVSVVFTRQQTEDWEHNVEGSGWIADENKSESSRSRTIDYIQDESGKKVTVTFAQSAGVKTYGTPTVYLGSIADIPASGGTAATPTYTYSQLWGWNGKTNDGGTISSGASVVWSENISGSNLGTTAKARTKLGSRTLTVTLNGKSGSASIDVYQAENKIENVTQGGWVVSISANPSTFTEQGGTSQISASARASRTNHWTSGVTSAASDATGTPTLNIPTPVTGFSLSGTTLTVAENKTANQRSVVVRATLDTVYKEVTVTQSAYLVEWKYYFTTSTPTLNFDALGTTQMPNLNSYREKYINGSLVEGSTEGVSAVKDSTTGPIQDVSPSGITLSENTTTQVRTGTVVYKQVGSGKTVTITCNQAAGTITQQWVLREVSGFNTIPAAGGQVVASVESGYYDVINGTQRAWHNEAPEVDTNPGWISLTSVEYANNGYYTVKATGISNGSESSRSGKLTLTNSQKSLQLNISQSGASVEWRYSFNIYSPSSKVLNIPAKPVDPESIIIDSYRTKWVNGIATSTVEFVEVTVDTLDEEWVEVTKGSNDNQQCDLLVNCLENKVSSIRSITITIRQVGTSNLDQVDINQAAATVTTRDHIEYRTPLPSSDFNAENQGRSIFLISYRETLINGTVTNKVGVEPTWILSLDTAGSWASLASLGPSPSNPYEFEIELTVEENTTNQTRSGSVLFKNGTEEVENVFAFTQDAASIEISYDIYWALSDRGNGLIYRTTSYSLDSRGEADRIHLFLLCDKITTINGNETSRTIINTGPSELTNYGPVYMDANGEPSALIQDDGGQNLTPGLFPELKDRPNTYNIVIGSLPNEGLYQETITMTYNKDVMDGSTPVGKVPAFYWVIDPIPYQRVFEFSWKQEGSTITNITLDGDIYGSSAGSRDIISYESLRRNGVEFNRRYIKPTFIPPSEDWLQVIDNGQNADNSYNWAFKALTNNEGESARNQSVRFEQPGNGNQSLYAYVSQDPMATEQLTCELGNYYSYGASDMVNMGFGWSSRDGGDSTGNGGMSTAGGYLGAHISLSANNDSIDMSAMGSPTYAKPLKIKLSNIRKVKEISYDNTQYTGLSVGYSQQDYKLGIVMGVGMESYFQLTPSILSESGQYGGGIQIQVTLKQTYNGYNGDSIADITLTPKDSNLPTLYLNIAWGNP